ncbi:MAG: hypothetical protein VX114_01915 [Chloroflexota bacterium]|nr:hypothetical protein [Chloroflexota bacterium]|tara:strand:+ start:478 stop:1104 length:627 start_codon:yes stop_codon:yes gene_type:complete
MILIIHKNEINLKNHLNTKNVEKLESIGEMNFFKGTSVPLKDEVIIFKCNDSKIELLVGLKWIKSNYDINSIIFFDYVDSINNNVLENHLIIPLDISCLDDLPLEWGNNPYLDVVKVKNPLNKKIRKVIHKTNIDFFYGNILSIDSKIINQTLISELNNLGEFDAHNNLIFTCNKFAHDNEIDIYNICLGRPLSKKNFDLKKIFENLF